MFKRTDTYSAKTTLRKLFISPSKKGSSLKGENLLPVGANALLLE